MNKNTNMYVTKNMNMIVIMINMCVRNYVRCILSLANCQDVDLSAVYFEKVKAVYFEKVKWTKQHVL
jgi:hypothetical protein